MPPKALDPAAGIYIFIYNVCCRYSPLIPLSISTVQSCVTHYFFRPRRVFINTYNVVFSRRKNRVHVYIRTPLVLLQAATPVTLKVISISRLIFLFYFYAFGKKQLCVGAFVFVCCFNDRIFFIYRI